MIIKTGFADGNHSRIFRELAQRSSDIVVCDRLSGSWMNANDCKKIWVFLGKLNRATAAFNRCPDCENSRHASLGRTPQDFIEIGCEFGIIEVGVSFYEHRIVKMLKGYKVQTGKNSSLLNDVTILRGQHLTIR